MLSSAPGLYNGYSSVVGAATAWEALVFDNGDTSYVVVPKVSGSNGMVSVSIGGRRANLIATNVQVTCTAKIETGAAPQLQIGVCRRRDGAVALGSTQVIVGSYVSWFRDFATNPIAGGPWDEDGFTDLELYMSTVIPVLGSVRVTRLRGVATFTLPTVTKIEGVRGGVTG